MILKIGAVLVIVIVSGFTCLVSGDQDIGKFEIDKVNQAISGVGNPVDSDGYGTVEMSDSQNNYPFVVIRIIGYLVLISALIFIVAWFIRKAGLAGASRVGGGCMDILEVLSFGQNRNTILVRVMDTVYLLGQTPGSIVLLEKIEGQKAIDLIASSKGGTSIVQFKDAFNNFLGKIKKSS
ncbi:flagellar biosynthetic protein FliO [Chitinispirillales bacterium ANBcel5]|uniref:FliO/MopB family protein n=1 Tax=Cellulosispirillum alkaliphilum TaxID=3039283 RepID=UPI002A52F660|nr:flagellar biosynthetic protein FliO [Chitinispirillales bacterium ANBcel5]